MDIYDKKFKIIVLKQASNNIKHSLMMLDNEIKKSIEINKSLQGDIVNIQLLYYKLMKKFIIQ